jgi:hypothetical protein
MFIRGLHNTAAPLNWVCQYITTGRKTFLDQQKMGNDDHKKGQVWNDLCNVAANSDGYIAPNFLQLPDVHLPFFNCKLHFVTGRKIVSNWNKL